MNRMKPITLYCPTCDEPFYCTIDPLDRSVGIMGATIVDVWREVHFKEGLGIEAPCIHVQTWFDRKLFEYQIYDQLDRDALEYSGDGEKEKHDMSLHTPGPWIKLNDGHGVYAVHPNDPAKTGRYDKIALVFGATNVSLIVKAPEMYDLLKELGLPINETLAPTGLAHKARVLLREINKG